MTALALLLTRLLYWQSPVGLYYIYYVSASTPRQEFTDCPAQRVLRVRIDDGDRIVSVKFMDSSTEFLHISERTRREAASGVTRGRKSASSTPQVPCFYQGSVEGEDGLAMAKQRDGWISGTFHYARSVYEIPEQVAPTTADAPPLTGLRLPPLPEERTCGVSARKDESVGGGTSPKQQQQQQQQQGSGPAGSQKRRYRRRLRAKLDTLVNYSERLRKYIRLILVGDESFLTKQSRNMTRALDRLWEIGNYVNGLYKQLGVHVVTVFAQVFNTDPYTLTTLTAGANSSVVNATELLDLFSLFRMQSMWNRHHSAVHLVSGLKFAGGSVGLAYTGKLCTFRAASGVSSDQDVNSYGVAVTVAHELGHNLGLFHDEDEKGCYCPDTQGCVMAGGSKNRLNPLQFAPCSVNRFLELSMLSGISYCISDPPSNFALALTKAFCGNKVVDSGEDCDCGQAKLCDNRCCDPSTCKFTAGALCASGDCCNTRNCTFKAMGTTCREGKNFCDLPEYCNGSSEWCPQFDDYKTDGTECLAGKAYCYNGQCEDRDSRCAKIFVGFDVKSAPSAWSVATTLGTSEGYCSYRHTSLNPLLYSYTACTIANKQCGLLYCVGKSTASRLEPRWMGLDRDDTGVLSATIRGVNITSASYARLDLSHAGYRDPGLVPNGAECGENLMCVDSECVAARSPVTCPNCTGICAKSGTCFCIDEHMQPHDCKQARLKKEDWSRSKTTDSTDVHVPSGVAGLFGMQLRSLLISVSMAHCLCWATTAAL